MANYNLKEVMNKKIAVAMSGGIDSSMTAFLLKKQGYEVVACFMRNWDSALNNDTLGNNTLNDDICPQEEDYNDAKSVADALGLKLLRKDYIKEYWDNTVGSYTKENPWVNIDNALNIEWADMQSRVRGQDAFNTGHKYCVQHLRACYYMASNMRDAYKSEIARDCETYEKSLQKIQTAAESVIESYND